MVFTPQRKKPAPNIGDFIWRVLVWCGAIVTLSILIFLIGNILVRGIPFIRWSLFSFTYNSTNVSLFPALVTTVMMTVLSLLTAVPLAVSTAIYLVEYAKKSNKAVHFIRVTAETLAGIPSIVYGLFGLLFFVTYLKWGFSLLAGSFTLSMMILPLIMRTTEEALKAVPDAWREGAFGLGAGRLRTIFVIILPAAIPGILAGIILAIGRIVGETAALIYTAGTVAQIPTSVFNSGRTMSVHMYALSSEGLYTNEAYATAVVLLVIVIGINTLSAAVAKKLTREQ